MNHKLRIKNLIIILLIIGLILPSFSFAQTGLPESGEEAGQMAEKGLTTLLKDLPGALKQVWSEEAVPIWLGMWNKAKKPLEALKTRINGVWDDIRLLFGLEVEKRKPAIQEEFQKEKQELKKEAPKVGKSLWQRFKELLE